MSEITVERLHSGIGIVSINRPEKRNACNQSAWQQIADAFTLLGQDNTTRLAILTGAGGHFSAGDDITAYNDAKTIPGSAERHRMSVLSSYDAILNAPFPVLAAIEGVCVGGAVSLAMCCDFRVAHPSARICIPVAKLSLVYPTIHIQRLVQLVGASFARRWLYSAEFVDSAAAFQAGFFDAVNEQPAVATAIDFCAAMLDRAPLSIAGTKRQINAIASNTLAEERERIEAAITNAEESSDYQAAVQAFREKSSPVFTGR
jgi:enoyl-CoA hydratase/carnithine racemase